MSEIGMTGEMRTDYDCEATGLPAQHWAEAVFRIAEEELIFEISVEKDVIVAVMSGEKPLWKGTLKGFKDLLTGPSPASP